MANNAGYGSLLLMRRLFVVIVLVLVTAGICGCVRRTEPTFYLGGIQVNEPDHEAWIQSLEGAGMNTVSVTVYAHQGDWDSANLWFDEDAPWVINEIRLAKAHGFRVVLILRVALDHAFARNKFFWHGMIMPRTDSLVDEWFDRYGRFVLHWARIAETEGVDVLAVASEMNTLTNTVRIDELPVLEEYWSNPEKVAYEQSQVLAFTDKIEERHLQVRGSENYSSLGRFMDDEAEAHRLWARQVSWLDEENPVALINARRRVLESHWIDMIERIRKEFGGRLTYGANFDQYEFVSFWDRLDLLAINAYFPLRQELRADLDIDGLATVLEEGWREVFGTLRDFLVSRGIPDHRVLFTELGYTKRANCTIRPWAADGFSVVPSPEGPQLMVWADQPTDPTERALAVKGLFNTNQSSGGNLLAGILYWKLSTVPSHEKVEPFVLLIGDQAPEDPLLDELARFSGAD